MSNWNLKALIDAVGHEKYRTSFFESTPYFNKLYDRGVLTKAHFDVTNIMRSGSVPFTINYSLNNMTDVEPNVSRPGNGDINISRFKTGEVCVKTNVTNNWVGVSTIEFIFSNNPNAIYQAIGNKFSSVLYRNISNNVFNICKGLCNYKPIVLGGHDEPFHAGSLNEMMAKKKDLAINKIMGMFMHADTFSQIDRDWDISLRGKNLYPKSFFDIGENGNYKFTTQTRAAGIPIYFENKLPRGSLFLLDKNTFEYSSADLTNDGRAGGASSVLEYSKDAKINYGSGEHFFILNHKYVIHPREFTFVGKLGKNYRFNQGVENKEWAKGGHFELIRDVSRSPILILNIKMDDGNYDSDYADDVREYAVSDVNVGKSSEKKNVSKSVIGSDDIPIKNVSKSVIGSDDIPINNVPKSTT